MLIGNPPTELRRSSRVPAALPIHVTSLAGTYFSELCKTLVVNAHGCAILSPVKFAAGIKLRLHRDDGRETTAHVVSCQPIGPDNRSWRLGAKLDRPENFWGLNDCPKDWAFPALVTATLPKLPAPSTATASAEAPSKMSQSPEATLDLVARRLEAPMRRMIAESLSPLQAQLTEVKETLARRQANPSRFEVSLSSIPPELEQQLEARLRKDIGPKVLEESRNHYAHLLETAKSTIDQRITEGYGDFMRRASEELKVVEKRAQDISAQISASAQEQLRRGLEDFQQKLLDGGNSLKRLSEELLEFLQQNLNDEHNARRQDLEQLRAAVAAESSRLRKDVESLDNRIAKLDESARSLESGLDKRLSLMASNTVKDVRSQFESVANEIQGELTASSVKILGEQLDEAIGKITTAQKDMVASVSESLDVQKTGALQAFEHSMEEMAKFSVERWRLKLAAGLNALAKSVGEQFQAEAGPSDSEKKQ